MLQGVRLFSQSYVFEMFFGYDCLTLSVWQKKKNVIQVVFITIGSL